MTTMRRRKQWLMKRHEQSLNSKRSAFQHWAVHFLERVRAAVETAVKVFKAMAAFAVTLVKVLKEQHRDRVEQAKLQDKE